ncbi:MAG TPA: cytochrome C, partial [Polyangia bacterium]
MVRILAILGLIFTVVIGGAAVFVVRFKPAQRPPSTDVVERTPARIERGRYLVNNVLGCFDCHADRDLTRYGGPLKGPLGAGGECFGEREKFPGTLCMPNITPHPTSGIGNWTDGEIKRAIREGIGRDGQALFPIMPYTEYKALSEEDTNAAVAYLRTIESVDKVVPRAHIEFPVKYFIKLAPKPLDGPVADPPAGDRLALGKYLARVSGCISCHTPVDKRHLPIAGQELSGGQEFTGPFGTLRSANLTPHATGLGDRTEAAFVGLFKAFAGPPESLPAVTPDANTVMPWTSRAQLTEADLGAIYAYLRSVPAIERAVEKRT